MYKKIIGSLALACSLAISSTAFAFFPGCGDGMKKMVESLNLDTAQKEKVKPILETLKSSLKASGEQMNDLDKQIKEQTTSATMDQSAIDGLIDKKAKLIGDMMKAKATAKNQVYNILNEQQKTKIQEKMKQKEAKMAEAFKNCHDEE